MDPLAIILVLIAWIVLLIPDFPSPSRNFVAIAFIIGAIIVVAWHGGLVPVR